MSRPLTRSRAGIPAADLLHHTLMDSAGSYRRCKIILDAELKRISTELNRTDLLPARRAELLMQLLEVQRVLGQDVKSIGQLIAAKPTPTNADANTTIPTAQDILLEITEGRKARR